MSASQQLEAFASDSGDMDAQLGSVTSASLLKEIMHDGHSLDLTQLAPNLVQRPLLVVTATDDDRDDQAFALLASLERTPAAQLTAVTMQTDHLFGDHRRALETAVVTWLAKLPIAPTNSPTMATLAD